MDFSYNGQQYTIGHGEDVIMWRRVHLLSEFIGTLQCGHHWVSVVPTLRGSNSNFVF